MSGLIRILWTLRKYIICLQENTVFNKIVLAVMTKKPKHTHAHTKATKKSIEIQNPKQQ